MDLGWLTRWRRRPAVVPITPGTNLFDPTFLRRLEQLSIVSRRMYTGKLRAERRTRQAGTGIEFASYREYAPGDDLRTIDWSAYQRLGKFMVRQFEESSDVTVSVLIDASLSMAAGGGVKFALAQRLAASLGFIALSNLDRVAVGVLGDGLRKVFPPMRGKARAFRLLRFLTDVRAAGATDLAAGARAFLRSSRPGPLVLLTDGYDPKGIEGAVDLLRYHGYECSVVIIADGHDLAPGVHGDVAATDCETGESVEITVTHREAARLAEEGARLTAALEQYCRSHQVRYLRADVAHSADDIVLRFLRTGGLLAG